jgi:predicted component of type VI protein secretion system
MACTVLMITAVIIAVHGCSQIEAESKPAQAGDPAKVKVALEQLSRLVWTGN